MRPSCLIVLEQPPETRPTDERVENSLVILVGHTHDDHFQNKIRVHSAVGLSLEDIIDFSEKAKRQEPLAPQRLTLVRCRLNEVLSFRRQDNHVQRGAGKAQQLGCLDGEDDAGELPTSLVGNADDGLLIPALMQILQQADYFNGGYVGQRLNGSGRDTAGGPRFGERGHEDAIEYRSDKQA